MTEKSLNPKKIISKLSSVGSKLKGLLFDGFFHILTGNFLTKAISMVSSITIVRLMDKVVYADLTYADNLYSYISLASGLGMASALLKYCSSDQNKETDKAYINYSMKIGGIFELVVSIVMCVIIQLIDIPYPNARIFIWSLALYPLLSYFLTVGSIYMRTQLENRKYAYVGLANSLFICVFSIVFVLLFGAVGIIPARYLSVILVLGYVLMYCKKQIGNKSAVKLTKDQKKAFFNVGISLGVASFFSGIMPINETFLVNNIIKDAVVTSNFRVAGLLPQLLFLVSGAITVYYFPIIARITDFSVVRKKVVKMAIVNGIIIVFLTILGVIFTPFIIKLLYGEKYLDAVSISYLLWIMRATNCVVRMVPINMLPAIGKTKFNLYMSIVSCGLQCLIDYVFINSIGINGVAIGATIVYFVSGIAYWLYFFHCCKTAKKDIKE